MIPLNILIGGEFSGELRNAFRNLGHNAWSCDLLDAEVSDSFSLGHIYHLKGDVRRVLNGTIPRDMVVDSNWRGTPIFIKWDAAIFHPECTFLANSGAKHLYKGMKKENGRDHKRWANMRTAAAFYAECWEADIPCVAVENPVMHGHAAAEIKRRCKKHPHPKKRQFVQPWMFGHKEVKATGLALRNLPPLEETDNVRAETMALPYAQRAKVHYASPGPDRWKDRSRTLRGLAEAAAAQWPAAIRKIV